MRKIALAFLLIAAIAGVIIFAAEANPWVTSPTNPKWGVRVSENSMKTERGNMIFTPILFTEDGGKTFFFLNTEGYKNNSYFYFGWSPDGKYLMIAFPDERNDSPASNSKKMRRDYLWGNISIYNPKARIFYQIPSESFEKVKAGYNWEGARWGQEGHTIEMYFIKMSGNYERTYLDYSIDQWIASSKKTYCTICQVALAKIDKNLSEFLDVGDFDEAIKLIKSYGNSAELVNFLKRMGDSSSFQYSINNAFSILHLKLEGEEERCFSIICQSKDNKNRTISVRNKCY